MKKIFAILAIAAMAMLTISCRDNKPVNDDVIVVGEDTVTVEELTVGPELPPDTLLVEE